MFSPPWCDMTDTYCSLQEIPIMSYLPDSFKVRSGPGVSAIKKFQLTYTKWFDKLTTLSQPVESLKVEQVEGQITMTEIQNTKQSKTTADILHKIQNIEKKVLDLKLSILKDLSPSGKKVILLKGIFKEVDITEQDVATAKKSIYCSTELEDAYELCCRHTCPSLVVYRQPKNQFKSFRDF